MKSEKTLDYYMSLPYKVSIQPDPAEGGYVAWYPDLPGCVTVGETLEEAFTNAEDARRAWLEAAVEDGNWIAEPTLMDSYSGQFKLRIPKSLHRSLAEHAQEEGTSMNQYCLYLLAKNDALHSKDAM